MAATEVVVLNEGELANRLRQLNIPTVILPEANMSSLQIFWRLIRIIFTRKPDVVHTHRQKENILGGKPIANSSTLTPDNFAVTK
jgi:hypothetical protein